ncbi:MAG: hypothetical protein IKS39_10295 [Clostridia bacterium]|nr:hypothetical protein [Clostridia bacterium]
MSKKILAIALALLMVLCVVPYSAFAESTEPELVSAQTRVNGWNGNFGIIITKLLNNEKSAHWKYVAENNENLARTMLTYTAFALYDDAWKNGFDNSVSIDNAEKILCSLIEKVDANIGESKFNEILKVLKTASDFNDLLQKVNGYVKISDTLTSTEWTTAFKYIKYAIELGDLYEEERDRVIEAYAQILSVQAANDYYKDFLNYLANNCQYNVVVTAARNLVNNINSSVKDIIKKEVLNAGGFAASKVLTTAARIAMQSNAYTAVALKVYDVGTSVVDALWNTSDQYAIMDQLYTTFFVEDGAVSWVEASLSNNDKEWYEFAIGLLLGLREAGSQSLYDLKLAQNEGIIGKIKNQINYNISFEQVDEMAFLELAKEVLFKQPVSEYKPIKSIVTVNTNAFVSTSDVSLQNQAEIYAGDKGYYSTYLNDAIGLYVKTLFMSEDENVIAKYGADTFVTAIVEKIGTTLFSFSFTNAICNNISDVIFNSDILNGATYTSAVDGEAQTRDMDSTFQYPAYNAVTPTSVVNAVYVIARNEVKGKVLSIGDIIDNIFKAIENFFNKIFKRGTAEAEA